MSITRVSVDSAGNQGDYDPSVLFFYPSISADGRFVAFPSGASNLVPGDTNGTRDIFVRDTLANITTRLSVNSAGNQGNNTSASPSISANGRFVAFSSSASNLIPGDINTNAEVFVRDTLTNTTTGISVGSAGNQGNGDSYRPSISGDGRFVAFLSRASNIVPGDTNLETDIFVRDTLTNTTTRVSLDSAGNQGNGDSYRPSISVDGRFVAFVSDASNLVPGDINTNAQIFVRDTLANTTTCVSVDSAGNQGDNTSDSLSISANGRFVAFGSFASNLVPGDTNLESDIFVRDTLTNTTTRVSLDSAGNQANSGSFQPSISADGRFVVFESLASNLVPGDTNGTRDIFVRDMLATTTTRVSVDSAGNQANSRSFEPSISADGRRIAFQSWASNLVPGDTNNSLDFFVFDTTNISGNNPPANNVNGTPGNDILTGTSDNDMINGVEGNDVLPSLWNNDVFVLGGESEVDTIADFAKFQDTVQLINSLTFRQLSILRGTEAPLIEVGGNGEVLASLIAFLLISFVLKVSSRSRV
jgi:hypothetical protein